MTARKFCHLRFLKIVTSDTVTELYDFTLSLDSKYLWLLFHFRFGNKSHDSLILNIYGRYVDLCFKSQLVVPWSWIIKL